MEAAKKTVWVRSFVDYAPAVGLLIALLITRSMEKATWVLVILSVVALAVGWIVERRLAPIPLFAGTMALVFGGLTLYFHDPKFVKMKMTFVEAALAAGLLGGLVLKKNPLKALLGDALTLPDAAWRNLTIRYALFFIAAAVANEIIWRTQTDTVWAFWKVGFIVITLVFSFTQVPFIMKHMPKDAEATVPPPADPGF